MAHIFTSLRHPLEKLQEAEYFLAGVAASNGLEFQFNLNAFLGACRSTTFVIQKSMAQVPGFSSWYRARQDEMKADATMGFFLELRNISQHEGPVSYVGGSTMHPDRWTHRFAGNRESVPPELKGVDVSRACADHLVKLARLLLTCFQTFPFASCPVKALSPKGMAELRDTLDDIGAALSLPSGYLDVGNDLPISEKLRILSREFEPLNLEELERIARGDLRNNGSAIWFTESIGSDLTDMVAETVEDHGKVNLDPRSVFLTAVVKSIEDVEKNEADPGDD